MVKYECIMCNYSTSNKADHNKHCKTKKHINKSNKDDIFINKKTIKMAWTPLDSKKNQIVLRKNINANFEEMNLIE